MFGWGSKQLELDITKMVAVFVMSFENIAGRNPKFWHSHFVLGFLLGSTFNAAKAANPKRDNYKIRGAIENALKPISKLEGLDINSLMTQAFKANTKMFNKGVEHGGLYFLYTSGQESDELSYWIKVSSHLAEKLEFGSERDRMVSAMLNSIFIQPAKRNLAKPNMNQDPSHKEEVLEQIIRIGRYFNCKSAREAAELVLGHPMPDDEWEQRRELYENAW